MQELPIFPLDLVLLPYSRVQLHIFEPRYIEMLEYCLDNGTGFGINLVRMGFAEHGPAEPYLVGTYAHIIDIHRLENGRFDITVEGRSRFRIRDLSDDLPYLVAKVEDVLDDIPEDLDRLDVLVKEVTHRCEQMIHDSADSPDFELKVLFPEDPEVLSFSMMNLLPFSDRERQSLLETTDVIDRLERLILKQQESDTSVSSPIRRLHSRDLSDWVSPN
jgi:uncharacterized protein